MEIPAAPLAPTHLASAEFKEELAQAATEVQSTATYSFDAHQAVAKDAAVMAASKSADFAEAAEKIDAEPSEMNKEIEILREKLDDTLVSAKATLEVAKDTLVIALNEVKGATIEGYEATVEAIGNAYVEVKERSAQAIDVTYKTVVGGIEGAKEKTGEALEYIGEQMKTTGELLTDKADSVKSEGLRLEREAELNQAKLNLTPISSV
eukprot:TRINITY_DN63_c0_g1_i1.p2 TRINITY_DN63_c0_g1~~TRINITY_DN63_c0_g1_i1.p2  ORF type:complete len:208 (+),score=61.41 TRINITY_DN63_c0_g1_i1:980-1603(+)